tara:strand:+ start:104 stop:448 length:345 start_codon:yes stop_codon:yes gene_type:complete
MNIDPLESILKIYKDKNKVFQDYFDNETLKKISNKIYYEQDENDIYLNDNITFVKKNTGKFYKSGKVISIDNSRITIKTSNHYLTLDSSKYYIFIKQKNKTNDRDFYKALMNNL